MRILMVSDVYFPRVNGVSTSIQTFARELGRMGHEVTLIAPAYGAGDEAGRDLFRSLHRVPSRRLYLDPEDRMMRRGDLFRLEPALRAGGFDLVHIQTPFVAHYAGLALARALGVPRIATYHTFFEEYLFFYVRFLPRAWLRRLARRFSRAQCNDLDALVVPSTAMRDTLQAYGVTTPMRVIPTGLDPGRFRGGDGARFRAAHGIDPARPVLVHVGRIAHEKNIDFLLQVLARVRERRPDVLLVIAGEGPALGHLQALGRHLALQDNLLFVGYLDREGGLLDCYRAGDLFVFSSRTETQGLVLLEAMMLGVPVVSTAAMGTRDVLVDGRGALVAPDDVAGFAESVLSLLEDARRREALADAAPGYAAGWSAAAQAERLARWYQELVEGTEERAVTAPARGMAGGG